MKEPTMIFRALADPTRRQILQALKEKDMRAGDIVDLFTMTGPSVSRHLSILKAAGLVSERREGNAIIYTLEPEKLSLCLSDFLSAVCPTELVQKHRRRNKK
ncbi:MAG: metalloregulator ArsR/SmtB family transcription factor [Candidatus Obscuribacterales bacterium]|jgi:DNA-binding transcriptional ArsR family regulator